MSYNAISCIFDYVKFTSYGNTKQELYVPITINSSVTVMSCTDPSNNKKYSALFIDGVRLPIVETLDEVFKAFDKAHQVREQAWEKRDKELAKKLESTPPELPTKKK